MTAPIRGVIVDLDDTLFPQSAFLTVAWGAVADAAAPFGVPRAAFRDALHVVAAEGSDRGRIIDRALGRVGCRGVPIEPLLEAFRGVRPLRLPVYPGTRQAMAALRARVPVALLTDGEPGGQRAKLAALGPGVAADALVITDEIGGRAVRKPAPMGFVAAARALRVPPAEVVVVGDRPDKDIRGAIAAGMRAIRVRTGEHAGQADEVLTWATAPTFADAVEYLLALLDAAPDPARGQGTSSARRPLVATAIWPASLGV